MKKYLYRTILAAVLLFAQLGLCAQDLETGYFLGGNPYAFRLNPAFQSERSIFSLALGQTGAGVWSNLGVSTLFYPDNNGSFYSFLNNRVNTSDFMRKVSRNNYLDIDARVNLLTIGFMTSSRRYFTIDVNVRSLNAANIPYDLFSFWKEGIDSHSSFDFSGLGARSKSYIETSFGWSRNFDNVFNAGIRFKGLVGIAEAEILYKNMKLARSNEHWEVQAKGFFHASSPALAYSRTEEGDLDPGSIKVREGEAKPAGFGAAVDLGASWNVLPDLTLSASILDLGTMRWNREIRGASPEEAYSWEPSGQNDAAAETWQEEFERAFNSMSGLVRFKDAGAKHGEFEMLPTQFLLGAEFRMPFYDRLSVGALYTGRVGSSYARHTGRISLNWNPLNFLSMSTGTTLNRFGESIGFALNLHPAGINLLVGCDYIPFSSMDISSMMGKEMPGFLKRLPIIPSNQMKCNVYVGLNLAFGHRKLDHRKYFLSD